MTLRSSQGANTESIVVARANCSYAITFWWDNWW